MFFAVAAILIADDLIAAILVADDLIAAKMWHVSDTSVFTHAKKLTRRVFENYYRSLSNGIETE